MELYLIRNDFSDHGTFGSLLVYAKNVLLLSLYTGELPWLDNKPNMSCVPVGEYIVAPYSSNKYPEHYKLLNVPGREAILIHEGNFCGNVSLGYRTNVQGCILVGTSVGTIQGQKAVLSSRPAMRKLRQVLGNRKVMLVIKNV